MVAVIRDCIADGRRYHRREPRCSLVAAVNFLRARTAQLLRMIGMKRNATFLVGAAAMVLGFGWSAACAEVGDLVARPHTPGWTSIYIPLVAKGDAFADPAEGDGTVNPRAVIAALQSSEGGPAIKVAIDSLLPDAADLDLLRIDFSGKGLFHDGPTVPLGGSAEQGSVYEFKRDGKIIPALVIADYQPGPAGRSMQLRFGTALEGDCRFGERVYPVRFIDRTSNLRCNDKAAAIRENGRVIGATNGDAMVIGDEASGPQAMAREFDYGQPVKVDGVWYDVKLTGGGAKVVAEPLDLPAAWLEIPHDKWVIKLISQGRALTLYGSREPVAIPAGDYSIVWFAEEILIGRDFATLRIDSDQALIAHVWTCGFDMTQGRARTFKAVAGETVKLPLGSPLIATVDARVEGRTVTMEFSVVGSYGASLDWLQASGGKLQAATIKVVDASGEVVHTAGLENYWAGAPGQTHTWRVPAGLSGEFTIEPQFSPKGFKVTTRKTTVTIQK